MRFLAAVAALAFAWGGAAPLATAQEATTPRQIFEDGRRRLLAEESAEAFDVYSDALAAFVCAAASERPGPDEERAILAEAKPLFAKWDDGRAQVHLEYSLGVRARDDGELRQALDAFRSIVDRPEVRADPAYQAMVLYRLVETALALADYADVHERLAQAERLVEDLPPDEHRDWLRMALFARRFDLEVVGGASDRLRELLARGHAMEAGFHPELADEFRWTLAVLEFEYRVVSGVDERALDAARVLVESASTPRRRTEAEYRCAVAQMAFLRNLGQPVPESVIEALHTFARSPDLRKEFRMLAAQYAAQMELERRAWDACKAALEVAEEMAGEVRSSETESILAAVAARLALGTGAGTPVLEARTARLRAAVAAELRAWRSTSLLEEGFGFLHLSTRRDPHAALLELEHALAIRNAAAAGHAPRLEPVLEAVLDAHAAGTLTRSLGCERGDLETLRAELLGERDGILLFMPGSWVVHVLAVDREGIVYDRANFAKADALRQTLSSEARLVPAGGERHEEELERARSAGRELADELLSPAVRTRLRAWEKVYVSGDDLLGDFPVEALWVDGEWLGASHAVTHAPSLPLALHLARRARATRGRDARDVALVVASAPVDRPPLPFDVVADRKRFEPLSRFVHGLEATPAALLGIGAGDADVLAFLGHGYRDRSRVREACLALAPDGATGASAVGCDDVERGPPRPDVVVLTACKTAAASSREGDDSPQTMGAAFLRAGSNCVMQSADDLDYETSLLLLESLLPALAKGEDPLLALRDARRVVAARPEFAHPYFHALLGAWGS